MKLLLKCSTQYFISFEISQETIKLSKEKKQKKMFNSYLMKHCFGKKDFSNAFIYF